MGLKETQHSLFGAPSIVPECPVAGPFSSLGRPSSPLCGHHNQWSHSKENVETGSIFSINWTSDSTSLAAGGGNGSVLFAQVIDRSLSLPLVVFVSTWQMHIHMPPGNPETLESFFSYLFHCGHIHSFKILVCAVPVFVFICASCLVFLLCSFCSYFLSVPVFVMCFVSVSRLLH